jgi:Dolichyl-phosphate-mannose-protein mannosyltransferase
MSHVRANDLPPETAASLGVPLEESDPVTIPEKSRSEWAIALLLFVASCLYLRLFYNYTVLNGDEGVSLQGAQRILNGEVPYRDFFTFFTPGSYYWTALLFKIFGDSILVARAALIMYGGVFSVFTYLLARRVCSRWAALFTVYLLTLTCLPYKFVALHNWDSTLWACLALYLAIRFLEVPHWGFASATGILASLTCLFEQSKGGGLVLGLGLGFGCIALIKGRRSGFTPVHLGAFLAAFTLPLLITIGYFASQHSLPQMIADWVWPLRHYSSVNKLPYGWLELTPTNVQEILSEPWPIRLCILFILSPYFLVPALPLLALGFLGFSVLRIRKEQNNRGVAGHLVLVSGTLAGLLLSTLVSGRPDVTHILYLGPLFFLVLAWALDGPSIRSGLWSTVRPLFIFYIFLSFTALGMALLWPPLHAHVVLKTRRGDLKGVKADAVLEEIQARVRPGQKIFVYPYEPLYYYLTATLNPTKYTFLMPGMNTPEQFNAAMYELAAGLTPVVVFHPAFREMIPSIWPGTPLEALATKDIGAEYILAHYRPCKTLTSLHSWQFVFMVRKDLSCAGPF